MPQNAAFHLGLHYLPFEKGYNHIDIIDILSGLIWIHTVCKVYQQKTLGIGNDQVNQTPQNMGINIFQ